MWGKEHYDSGDWERESVPGSHSHMNKGEQGETASGPERNGKMCLTCYLELGALTEEDGRAAVTICRMLPLSHCSITQV